MPAALAQLRFDHTYARLHPSLYQVVDPTPLPEPRLAAWSPGAAARLGLDPTARDSEELLAVLAGARRLPGSEPIATLYAGHQFGVWVPELGDGRAILLGEVVTGNGDRWELQLKGAGLTRYSRMGDGRSVLRSAVREFLASEALAGLKIPTTGALAVVASPLRVYRERPETAATLLRLAPTHVRFGTFQVLAARGWTDRLRELVDYIVDRHYPDPGPGPDRVPRFLAAVAERTASLVADWMAAGFAHGVLNTDNMSILGLTLDYGPFGFQDDYDPGFICNHSDPEGRYAFDRQPAIGMWNLLRLAESLLPLTTADRANEALERYPTAFELRYRERMRRKVGLALVLPGDDELIADLLGVLAVGRVDYTRFFRTLARVEAGDTPPPPELLFLAREAAPLGAWLTRYAGRLTRERRPEPERRLAMNRENPRIVLRNHLAQMAIDRAEAGDFTEIERLRDALADPFTDRPALERYDGPVPPWGRELVVSCSS